MTLDKNIFLVCVMLCVKSIKKDLQFLESLVIIVNQIDLASNQTLEFFENIIEEHIN